MGVVSKQPNYKVENKKKLHKVKYNHKAERYAIYLLTKDIATE